MGVFNRKKITKSLTAMSTILIGFIPVYMTYDLYSKGPTPKKNVEVQYIGPSEPLKDLSNASNLFKLTLSEGNKPINNISIMHAVLTNSGKSPILPTEIHDNFSLNTQEPWSIIAISGSDWDNIAILPTWKKINDWKFEALPVLLNPGDRIWATVYLTRDSGVSFNKGNEKPTVFWKGHVVNLTSIKKLIHYLILISTSGFV